MSTRDIQQQLEEHYATDLSPTLISNITDRVLDDVKAWQSRPLERVYPIVYLDCLVVNVKSDRRIISKAVYLALGLNMDGHKELLGMWIGHNEGAKFWLSILTEMKNRGLKAILIACVDGLKGFPDLIANVYPQTKIQLSIVHMVRNSAKYVSYKHRKKVCADLKTIYTAKTIIEAEATLDAFGEKWADI